MSKQYREGEILKINPGSKDEVFLMVFKSQTETHVKGLHIDGVGEVKVPIALIKSSSPPTTTSLEMIKSRQSLKELDMTNATAATKKPARKPAAKKAAPAKKSTKPAAKKSATNGKVARTAPKRAATGESKLQQALAIAKSNKKLTRQELIQRLVTEVKPKCTPAGASTYASLVRAELGLTN